MNKKIAYIYNGNHIIHRKLAGTVTKNMFSISNIPEDFDVYLFEGDYSKPLIMRMHGKISKKAKIITLFSDPRLFYLKKNKMFDYKTGKVSRRGFFKNALSKFIIKRLDGALCAGKFQAGLFREYNKKSPLRIIYPFISEERYKKLKENKPNLSSHNILFIGHGPDYYVKGLDILIAAFREVKEKEKEAKLFILGKDWGNKKSLRKENIYFEGRREKIENYLRKCSLAVHIGRGEGFGVNVMESMTAGVPCIVSEFTGAKEFVEKLDKTLIININKKIVAKRILDYFAIDEKKKGKLSRKAREIGGFIREKSMLKLFKKEFSYLIKGLYKNE